MRSNDQKTRSFALRRTAKSVRQHKVLMRILTSALACMSALVCIVYISASLYDKSGSFTISLNKLDMVKHGLSLSETKEMTYKTSQLNADIAKSITNIAEESIPENLDSRGGGSHNGENYIAYTFYVQNTGTVKDAPVAYQYSVVLSNITNGLDDAIRVRVYHNGECTTYAKPAKDGGTELGTEKFHNATTVVQKRVEEFQPGAVDRYTMVVWIEGNDPECVDWLIGGEIKVDMDLKIVS